jgi:hypothetical protein
VLGFELGLNLEPLHQPLFLGCVRYVWDRFLQTICLGWLQTSLLLILCFLSSQDYRCEASSTQLIAVFLNRGFLRRGAG